MGGGTRGPTAMGILPTSFRRRRQWLISIPPTDYGLRTTDYGLRTTDYGLGVFDYGLGVFDYGRGSIRVFQYSSIRVFEGVRIFH